MVNFTLIASKSSKRIAIDYQEIAFYNGIRCYYRPFVSLLFPFGLGGLKISLIVSISKYHGCVSISQTLQFNCLNLFAEYISLKNTDAGVGGQNMSSFKRIN